MVRTLALCCVVGGLAVGCKPKKGIDKLKAQGEAKVLALEALGKASLPDLTEDKLTLKGAVELLGTHGGNTAVYAQEGLSRLTERSSGALFDNPFALEDAIRWTRGEPAFGSLTQEEIDARYGRLLGLTYVAVVKTVALDAAQLDGDTFKPGRFKGEAHLLELAGKHHGGFRFEATSSDEVKFKVYKDRAGHETHRSDDAALRSDLWGNANRVLIEGLKQHGVLK